MNWLTSRCAPLAALAVLGLAGCDTGTDLNVDLPDTTAINTEYKELSLDVATVRLVPVQTLKTDHYLVGRLADNVAGSTEARAYFNLVPGGTISDSLPSKLPRPLLDSAVMVMGFNKVYGSATTPVRFDVSLLQEPLDERQVYDSDRTTTPGASLGQNLSSRIDRTQRVTVPAMAATATSPATPAYTITASDQTVRLLLQRRAYAATPTQPAIAAIEQPAVAALFTRLTQPNFNQAALDAIFKGLSVAPSAGHTSSILSFGPTFDSRMVLYYHSADTALRRSYAVYVGPIYSRRGGASARDPRYYTQITSTLPAALAPLATGSGAVPPSVLGGNSYVQEGVGLGTRVTFKGLADLEKQAQESGLTINRAELLVPAKPFSNALFANPTQLFAVEVDANNNILQRTVNFQPYDRIVQADGANPLGVGANAAGNLVDASTTQPYYRLLITSYLQAYLSNRLEGNPASLVLVPSARTSSTLALNRAVLDATNIRLRVYYSKR